MYEQVLSTSEMQHDFGQFKNLANNSPISLSDFLFLNITFSGSTGVLYLFSMTFRNTSSGLSLHLCIYFF